MLRSRYAVDLYTGYSTVWACETAGEWELALEILKVIPETRAKPNVFGCASDVNLCYRQNRWQLGLYLINILSQVALLRI
ncbi:Pentatricopeptide repeat-containing protein [Durusdinium trenchii]